MVQSERVRRGQIAGAKGHAGQELSDPSMILVSQCLLKSEGCVCVCVLE